MATKEERQLLVTNKHGPTYKLHLNKETKRTTIAKALLANQTVKHMSIFVESNFMMGVSPESLRNLFRAIGSLPLENLHIYSYGDNMDIFPVQLIGDVLKVAFKLEVLACYFIELAGGKVSFDKFQDDLIEHPSLREVRFESCQLSDRMLTTHGITDKFFEALASLPNLESLDLTAPEKGYFGTISPAYLEHVAGTTERLSSLNLINFVLDNEHMSALNRALRINRDLVDLAISVSPDINSKLPALLATTRYLRHLKLQFDTLDDEKFLLKIAKGLEKGNNISRFELLLGDNPARLSPRCQRAFSAVPEKNGNIQYMDVEITDRRLASKAEFFLEVNSDGTRQMFENPYSTTEEIMDALIFASDDLQMVYYFLRTRPSLCDIQEVQYYEDDLTDVLSYETYDNGLCL